MTYGVKEPKGYLTQSQYNCYPIDSLEQMVERCKLTLSKGCIQMHYHGKGQPMIVFEQRKVRAEPVENLQFFHIVARDLPKPYSEVKKAFTDRYNLLKEELDNR